MPPGRSEAAGSPSEAGAADDAADAATADAGTYAHGAVERVATRAAEVTAPGRAARITAAAGDAGNPAARFAGLPVPPADAVTAAAAAEDVEPWALQAARGLTGPAVLTDPAGDETTARVPGPVGDAAADARTGPAPPRREGAGTTALMRAAGARERNADASMAGALPGRGGDATTDPGYPVPSARAGAGPIVGGGGLAAGPAPLPAEGGRPAALDAGMNRGVVDAMGSAAGRGSDLTASAPAERQLFDGVASRASEAMAVDGGPPARAGAEATAVASGPSSAAVGAATGSSSPDSELTADLRLARAPDDPEFAPEMTARMKLLVRDGVREARIQLHPAELGRLQITVNTEGDQARVAFVAETTAARDAIEQSLPRLRELFEQAGLQLAQSDVGQQGQATPRDPAPRPTAAAGGAGDGERAAVADGGEPPGPGPSDSLARIDTYI